MRRHSQLANNLAAKALEIRRANEDGIKKEEVKKSGASSEPDAAIQRSDTFKRFLRANHVKEDKENYFGYMFVALDKDELAD